jgi:DNA ligase (NAD+)
MADKSADNVLESIESAKRGRTLSRLLTGLGIPLVGAVAARVVAERYRTLPRLLEIAPDQLRQELGGSRGIGPKIADSVARYFADEENRAVLRKLLDLGVEVEEPAPVIASGPLAGASFCVTGTLSRPREEIHAAIRAAGGEVHASVGKGTTYLVAGEKVGKSKLTAAEKRGTKVIDEAALERLIAGNAEASA